MSALDRGMRDSAVLPTMKCAQCNQDVHIRLIGQHQCAQQPAVPALPAGMRARELSSFFDAPRDGQRLAAGAQAAARAAAESRVFPSGYKPAFHMLDEEISGGDDPDFDFDSMLRNASGRHLGPPVSGGSDRPASPGPRRIPDFAQSSSSLSIGPMAAGLSPLDAPYVAGHTSPTANGFSIRHEGHRSPDARPIQSPPEPAALPRPPPPLAPTHARSPLVSSPSPFGSALTLSAVSAPVSPEPDGPDGAGSIGSAFSPPPLRDASRRPPPPPVGVDAQICISARRAPGSPIGAPESPSLPRSGSATQEAAAAVPIPRGGARLAAAAEQAQSSSMPAAATGLARNPLDMLASLVQQPQKPPAAAATAAAAAPRRAAGPKTGAARSLKSAKLDSLLDDLVGSMQALSAEGRPESDCESMVSTASAASPADPGAGAAARDPAARSRLDSTVSSASTSSTLSAPGTHRRVHCAACGAGIVGAVVRPSALRSGDVPAGASAVEHQGRVYCVRDYRRMALVCRGCSRPCESTASRDAVHALDAWWHRRCFNCQECRQPFPDKSFYVLDGRPYCRYDYHKLNNSLCAACAEPIEGPCAQVNEGRFHPECFACAHCAEPLRDVYYAIDARFFCERHIRQHKSHRPADKRNTVMGSV
ncbi:hypothetical protein H4R18_004027 [Coemansia javaensis]|uniref:LIM zinc-binding domain-containing protein n=1 Tax=Coemansia javaensis TaxID=2761396 RepID=A0A9W8LGT9_9FUNG|nr:hypothetical protein H4R18_004027 [Coemansia javaensis]